MEQEVATINIILKELREFRTENNEKWNANDKRWEENDKRWEQNEKRWEENYQRWEQNEKRWEENDRRWEQNEKRWEQNNKRWEQNHNILKTLDKRVSNLEDKREIDKKEFLRVFDEIDKGIISAIAESEKRINFRLDKIETILANNEIEHQIFRKAIVNGNERLQKLEDWKDEFDLGNLATV